VTDVVARAPLRPTESPGKVRIAILNLLPDAFIVEHEDFMEATSDSVDRLRELIRQQKIRDTARRTLLASAQQGTVTITASKEAAWAGRLNFSSLSPLGAIEITIKAPDIQALIDYLAESTLTVKED